MVRIAPEIILALSLWLAFAADLRAETTWMTAAELEAATGEKLAPVAGPKGRAEWAGELVTVEVETLDSGPRRTGRGKVLVAWVRDQTSDACHQIRSVDAGETEIFTEESSGLRPCQSASPDSRPSETLPSPAEILCQRFEASGSSDSEFDRSLTELGETWQAAIKSYQELEEKADPEGGEPPPGLAVSRAELSDPQKLRQIMASLRLSTGLPAEGIAAMPLGDPQLMKIMESLSAGVPAEGAEPMPPPDLQMLTTMMEGLGLSGQATGESGSVPPGAPVPDVLAKMMQDPAVQESLSQMLLQDMPTGDLLFNQTDQLLAPYLDLLVEKIEAYEARTQIAGELDPEVFGQAEEHYRRGVDLTVAGDCLGAIRSFGEAQRLYRELGQDLGQVRTLSFKIGCCLKRRNILGYFSATLELLRLSESLRPLNPSLAAHDRREAGDFEGARQLYRELVEEHQRQGNAAGAARATIDLGVAHIDLGEYKKAKRLLREGLAVLAELTDGERARSEAVAHHSLGNLALATGRFRDATGSYCTALGGWRQLAEPVPESVTLKGLGLALGNLGHRDAARAMFLEHRHLRRSLRISE